MTHDAFITQLQQVEEQLVEGTDTTTTEIQSRLLLNTLMFQGSSGDTAWQHTNAELVRVLHALSESLQRLDRDQEALIYVEQGLSLTQVFNDEAGYELQGHILSTLGRIHRKRSSWDEARETFSRALTAYEKSGRKDKVAYALLQIGLAYDAHSDYESASEFYQRTLEAYEELGNRKGIPGRIHCSEEFATHLQNRDESFVFEQRDEIDIKGKGMMRTYFLEKV